MSHDEFVAGYRQGRIRVIVDKKASARFVSARMMLPVFVLPILGVAVALALSGYLIAGGGVFVLAIAFRTLVRASSRNFVLSRALAEPRFYEAALAARILRVEFAGTEGTPA